MECSQPQAGLVASTPSPGWRAGTAYGQTGLGSLPSALRLNEGLDVTDSAAPDLVYVLFSLLSTKLIELRPKQRQA